MKMLKGISSVFLTNLLFLVLLAGQIHAQKKEEFYPVSPNAAMFQRFQDFPVDLSNGLANISIPLYTLETRSLKVPIILKYHAGGVKPSDENSWVGLGWSLDCGGLISRNVRGRKDEGAIQYPNVRTIMIPLTVRDSGGYQQIISEPNQERKYNILGGYYIDGEQFSREKIQSIKTEFEKMNTTYFGHNLAQEDRGKLEVYDKGTDVYYLNIGALNGKFMLDQNKKFRLLNTEESVAIETEVRKRTDLHISELIRTYPTSRRITTATDHYIFGNWKISDDQGKTYFFGANSVKKFYTDSVNSNEINEWYLDKILDKNSSDSILFENIEKNVEPENQFYKRFFSGLTPSIETLTLGSNPSSRAKTLTLPYRIISEDKEVIFYMDNRYPKANKLDSIVVFGYDKKRLNKITFHYEFFKNSGRLKLKALNVDALDGGQLSSPYVFNYDEGELLPTGKYDPYATDYLGYYNGRIVSDRSADVSTDFKPQWPFNRLESLTSVVHPTGGTSVFEYEPNKISRTFPDWISAKNPLNPDDAGGMRIKKITVSDRSGTAVDTREYDYTLDGFDLHSGFLITPPEKDIIVSPYGDKTAVLFRNIGSNRYEEVIGGNPVQYGFVTERKFANGIANGKTENEFYTYEPGNTADKFYSNIPNSTSFSNIGNFPPYLAKDEYQNFLSGKIKEQRIYNSENKLLKKESYQYDVKPTDQRFAFINYNSTRANPFSGGGAINLPVIPLAIDFYYINYYQLYNKFVYLQSRTTSTFDLISGTEIKNNEIYSYGSPFHNRITISKTLTSRGDTLTSRKIYSFDYADVVSGESFTQILKNTRTNQQVANYNFVGNKLSSSDIIYFKNFGTSVKPALFPQYIYSYVQGGAINTSLYSTINSASYPISSFYNSTDYVKKYEASYSNKGELLMRRILDQPMESYIWADKGRTLIAKGTNTSYEDIAFTSFEPNVLGGWTYAPVIRTIDKFTGLFAGNLAKGKVTRTNLKAATKYQITYWIKGNVPATITGATLATKVGESSGWTNFSHIFTGSTTVELSGTGIIDELRLVPENATMVSFVYDSGDKILSQSDEKSLPLYYQYDNLNRLSAVQDFTGSVQKSFQYNNVKNSFNTTFYSPELSKRLRKSCPIGSIGNEVEYIVPYGKYIKADPIEAYLAAENDIHVNAQNYANQNGTCSPDITYYSKEYQMNYEPQTCVGEKIPLRASYISSSGKYTSRISQEDADQKAIEDVKTSGQVYMNRYGECKSLSEVNKITIVTDNNYKAAKVYLVINGSKTLIEQFPENGQPISFYMAKSSVYSVKIVVERFSGDAEPVLKVNGQADYSPTVSKNYNVGGNLEVIFELTGVPI